ncbi:MAG TPA: type II secretion system protein [Bryobacteraceae bacterium]|nr:type II secretion system protein [Bryobacteraceae bacterium]
MRRRNQSGLTLVELIVAFTIMLILTTMAVPLARSKVRAERERELIRDLREMRAAIDRYKDYCDSGYLGPKEVDTDCYPKTLDVLVKGVKLSGPNDKKIPFLRRIPRDPFTGDTEWGMHSTQDDPDSKSWGGQNVFDVYSKTDAKAPDGTPYSTW